MMMLRRVWISLLVLAIFSPVVAGETLTVYGPETFLRGSGKPVEEVRNFDVVSPGGGYVLHVLNGPGEIPPVNSARVILNGERLLAPRDFDKQELVIERLVSLRSQNILAVELKGRAGNGLKLEIVRSSQPHQPPSIEILEPADGAVFIEGEAVILAGTASNADEGDLSAAIQWHSDLAGFLGSGSPITAMLAVGAHRVTASVLDEQGAESATSVNVIIKDKAVEPPDEPELPPDPETVAPPLDTTGTTGLKEATAFLYSGDNPIQVGVEPDTIDARRAAVVRGSVKARGEHPLGGVTVSIKNHPEFGETLSRNDGAFDLVVNGGGRLTINYRKPGYLPVQRVVEVPWGDFALVDDIVMIPVDERVTRIELQDHSRDIQVARGSSVTDTDGSRQATVLFPRGTIAVMTLPDGSTQPLSTMHVRATEYTVGGLGPQTMPGELPPTSGYTYAVELGVDEAIAADATRVDFSQPLPFYVENFPGFPTGSVVPAGWYDFEKAAWVPSDNGRVIAILGVSGGLANLDVDGSGQPADAEKLGELGISDAERRQLAELYSVGQSLWRTPVTHFTPWDCNWPYGPPDDAEPPNQPEPETDESEMDPDCQKSSIIECQNAVLRQRVPIVGTRFNLNYRSDQVPGRRAYVDVPLSGDSIPRSLRRIELRIHIAGQRHHYSFPAQTGLAHRFIWDGNDAYGRPVPGMRQAVIHIGYIYGAVYYEPSEFQQAFARTGTATTSGNRETAEVILWQSATKNLQAHAPGTGEFGAWRITPQHLYDAVGKSLTLGQGTLQELFNLSGIIRTVAGSGQQGMTGDGGPAVEASLSLPFGVAVDPDGGIYIADRASGRVRYVSPEGIISTVAGGGQSSPKDGDLATTVRLGDPSDVALGADGSLYIAEQASDRVLKVDVDGVVTIAAGGERGFGGDGGPANEAKLHTPSGLAVGHDGGLYIADFSNHRIRYVDPAGIITTVAGTGLQGFIGEGQPAVGARLNFPYGVASASDGSIYIADTHNHRIRRVGPDGIISTVAGSFGSGFAGDGGAATQARLSFPTGVAVAPDGSLFIADNDNHAIRRVASNGVISTVAGLPALGSGAEGDNGPATAASLRQPWRVALGPDGNFSIADTSNHRVRQVHVQSSTALGESLIPSENGAQVFLFDAQGRHISTRDSVTGALRHQFHYDDGHQLTRIEDGDGNITRIERDFSGRPLAIIAPDGQRTVLTLDSNGYLTSVTDPEGSSHHLRYTSDGLLTRYEDPNGNSSSYDYDELGRLRSTRDAEGGGWSINRQKMIRGFEYGMMSAEGRSHRYRMTLPGVGGRLRTNHHPDGTQTSTRYSDNGEVTVVAPDGTETVTLRGPDPRFGMSAPVSKKTTTTTPGGRQRVITTAGTAQLANADDFFSHSALGETVSINGRTAVSEYEAVTRTWTYTSAAGRTGRVVLNNRGRPSLLQSTELAPLSYDYDHRGRLTDLTLGTGSAQRHTRLVYGSDGYVAQLNDALGRTVAFTHDRAGRLTRQTFPDGRSVDYHYDAAGNLTALIPPGREAHLFTYNRVNLEDSYDPPALGGLRTVTRYHYNRDRQLIEIARPDGRAIGYSYDNGGRLSRLNVSRGAYTYAYFNDTGQLAEIAAPDGGRLNYTYDGFLPVSESWSGAVAGGVSRSYDNNFWLAERCVNSSCVGFHYDNDGLTLQAGALSLTRHAQHGLIMETALAGVRTLYAYNEFGEATTYDARVSGSSLLAVDYRRDALGRIAEKTESLGGGTVNEVYQYDAAGRLTAVTRNGVATTWQYDSNGNRTHENGATIASYDEQDRLLTYRGASYGYTANGDLATKTENGATTSYDYDELGNLIAVSLPGDLEINYLVDGRNRRVGKKINGQLVQGFLYADQLNPIAELDGNGNIKARFVYGDKPNVPAYMVREGKTYRIISDHLGSPRLVIDTTTGEVVQRMDYDAWGNVVLDTHPGFQPFGFAGGIYDQQTGLVRFGFRDYDPKMGRWTAKDPIGFAGGDPNFYGYVLNDPVNLSDPTGLFVCSFLSILGDRNVEFAVGIGAGVGASGGLSLSSSGIVGTASVGVGAGISATGSIATNTSVNVGSTRRDFNVQGAVTVGAGAGVGGQASLSAGTDGVTATGSLGFGLGASLVSGLGISGSILKCDEAVGDCDN